MQYDFIMKEANKNSRKRFLLTGPSQVILSNVTHTMCPINTHLPRYFQLMHTTMFLINAHQCHLIPPITFLSLLYRLEKLERGFS